MIALLPPIVPSPSLRACAPVLPDRSRLPRRESVNGYRRRVRRIVPTARLETDARMPIPAYRIRAQYPVGPWQPTPTAAWRLAWEWLTADDVEGGES